jgi:hypothetical protein
MALPVSHSDLLSTGNASQLTASLLSFEYLSSDTLWAGRYNALLSALFAGLVELRDAGVIFLTPDVISKYMDLGNMLKMETDERLSPSARLKLQRYLDSVPCLRRDGADSLHVRELYFAVTTQCEIMCNKAFSIR